MRIRVLVLLAILLFSTDGFAQTSDSTEVNAIKNVVNAFFETLHTQDTVLYKKLLMREGQVWRVHTAEDPKKYDMRYFHDDLKSFNPDVILEEKALSFDINVYGGIGMAWVPYEFFINGKYSHCGIDIFTLIETDDGWKIVNASYTVDKTGCEELKNP